MVVEVVADYGQPVRATYSATLSSEIFEALLFQKFIVEYLDEKKRRIILPKEVVEVENLHAGDYIEIDVNKIKKKDETILKD